MSVRVSEEISGTEERIRMLRAELQNYNNKKLLENLASYNYRERKLKVRVLLYLREIDRRRLYLELGYSSMFVFCTERLGYTRSSACRRIAAARCAGKYPSAAEMLQAGEINITTLSMVSGIITPENHVRVFSKIRNSSRREVEVLISGLKPRPEIRDRVRPVSVLMPSSEQAAPGGGSDSGPNNEPGAVKEKESTPTGGSRPDAGGRPSAAGKGMNRLEIERRFELRFSAGEDFMKKLQKAKSLLSTRYPKGIGLELLFEELLDNYLEENDPERRIEKQDNRAAQKKPEEKHNGRSRHIPRRVRDEVYSRDGGRCSFVGRRGRRCNSTWNLQYDHVVPFGKGGDNSPENLRLLCGRHNRLMAEREYGREHMDSFRGSEP